MIFDRMMLKNKLRLSFLLILLITFLGGAFSVVSLYSVELDVDAVLDGCYPKIRLTDELIKRNLTTGMRSRDAILATDTKAIEGFIEVLEKNKSSDENDLHELVKQSRSSEEKQLIDAVVATRNQQLPKYVVLYQLVRSNQDVDASDFLAKDFALSNRSYRKSLEEFQKYQQVKMEQAKDSVFQDLAHTRYVQIGSALFALVLSMVIAFVLAKRLQAKMNQALDVAESIAAGNLNLIVDTSGMDEFSQLLGAMHRMQVGLSGVIDEIRGLAQSAERGNLAERIEIGNKKGFGKDVAEALNKLVAVTDTSLKDIVNVSVALANGDLSQKVTTIYPGAFGQAAEAANKTVNSLSGLVAEVRRVVDAIARGDFSQRIPTDNKRGYGKTLAELLNNLSATANEALTDISCVSQSLAKGDLTQQIEKKYPGLFGETADGINTTVANLLGLIGNVVEAIDAISTASQQISAGNRDLSARTEEQASSLEETAASMEQFTTMIQQNTGSAKEASSLAKAASDIASSGGGVVKATVETMSQIQESSKKIGDIISVIDGIAFQTNILALNAAVEAARAGEQGKGFAVVASEVRSLAQRSANAAKEISALISDSVSKVERGTAQAEQAGHTMEEIVGSIAKVTNIVSGISDASLEQSAGVGQIAQAVSQMDQTTQQNAALVEEAAASAESLAQQAEELQRQVAAFKLNNRGTSGLASKAPAQRQARLSAPAKSASKKPSQLAAPGEDDGEWATF